MTSEMRELLTDFKAAARIGHPESLAAAFEALAALPEIAGNAPLDEAFLDKAILPLGKALAKGSFDSPVLQPFTKHPLTAVRAAAAAALAGRMLQGDEIAKTLCETLNRDRREEVRDALAAGLRQASDDQLAALLEVVTIWINSERSRPRQVGLKALPRLAAAYPAECLALIESLRDDSDPQTRKALAEAIRELAEQGLATEFLDVMMQWAGAETPPAWVIARALSGSWAAQHPDRALAILAQIAGGAEANKQIGNAIRALERNGAGESVGAALDAWKESGQPELQALARQLAKK
jgi:3-methyladenine DNA glycosylase AlkC